MLSEYFTITQPETFVDLFLCRTVALLINFGDRGKNPSISTSLTVLHILQDHYPERLGLSLIINVPFLVNAFFKMVMPLVDPITRAKVKFNPQVFKDGLFSEDQVMKEWWGGEKDFEYKHEDYWKDLVALCETRSKAWEKNWRTLGAKVGESEWAYKQLSSSPLDTLPEKTKEAATVTVAEVTPTESVTASKASDKKIQAEKKESTVTHAPADVQATSTTTSSATATAAGATTGAAGNADADAGGDAGAE